MHYAILCYDSEEVVGSWTKDEDDAAIAKLAVVQQKLAREGKLGPVARLMPTKQAKTLRKGSALHFTDGPFAETKEQLGGVMVLEANDLNHAIQLMSQLPCMRIGGSLEIRPINGNL